MADAPYVGPNLGPLAPSGTPSGVQFIPDAPVGGKFIPDAPQAQTAQPAFIPDDHANGTEPAFIPDDHPHAQSLLESALSPFTRYPGAYHDLRTEAQKQVLGGIDQLTGNTDEEKHGAWEKVKGAGNVAAGVVDYTLSPVNAAVRTVVGEPVENVTGIPKEYTEFAASLAIPGVGLTKFTKTGQTVDTARKIREIFNPEAVSPAAEDAAARIRSAGGQAARDTESTRAAFEDVQKLTRNLTDEQKLGLNDYIEGRSTAGAEIDPALKPVADAQREAVQSRRTKIEALDSASTAEFIQDYLPHIYKDPEAARAVFSGPAKEGTGRFLKKRSIPTLREAIDRGLEPVTLDPLEMTQRYVDTMDRFIATRQTLEGAIKDGHVKAYPPGEQPTGWVEVNTKYGGSMPYYAPADWARIYNNFVDRGWNKSETWGPVLNSVQRTANAVASLKLGLSGYHAVTMAKEAYASGLDLAVAQLASGKPLKAAVSAAKAPTKFITNAIRGKEVKDVYLGRKEGTPEMRQIVSLLTEGGGRMSGNRHAPDYRYSAMDSYWNTFKRGSQRAELAAAAGEARKAYGLGTVKVLAQQFGRIMQTTAKPLFEHYIPALKNGAAYDMMSAWLDANPMADHATQVKAARKIVDAIDDRFGEMISDNIFWNKVMKQSLQTAMLSYSWMLGSARALGGGTASLVRNPARLSMKHPDWKPQANYALAFPIVAATSAMAYQFLKTGTIPEDVSDFLGAWTGGYIGSGKNRAKERARTPGYEKEVLGWWHAPLSEAYHKLNPIIQMPIELAMNKEWKNQPIRHEGAPVPEQVKQILAYIWHSLAPISVEKLQEGRQKGSNISKFESVLGISNAPAWLQNPNSASASKYFSDKDWRKKENWDKNQARKME